MELSSGLKSCFWLAGRFTPRQVDWIVLADAVALTVAALIREATAFPHSPAGLAVLSAVLIFGTIPHLWHPSHPGPMLAVLAAAVVVGILSGPRATAGIGLDFGVYPGALYGNRALRMTTAAAATVILADDSGLGRPGTARPG